MTVKGHWALRQHGFDGNNGLQWTEDNAADGKAALVPQYARVELCGAYRRSRRWCKVSPTRTMWSSARRAPEWLEGSTGAVDGQYGGGRRQFTTSSVLSRIDAAQVIQPFDSSQLSVH